MAAPRHTKRLSSAEMIGMLCKKVGAYVCVWACVRVCVGAASICGHVVQLFTQQHIWPGHSMGQDGQM